VWSVLGAGCPDGCTSRKTRAQEAVAPAPFPVGARTETLAADVLFPSGSAALTEEGKRRLEPLVAKLRSATGTIHIRGYSDSPPVGHRLPGQLQKLSQARADAVKAYFVECGIGADMMVATGLGTANPKETRVASRRVEVIWEK
jgi:OOP family OmpA-OmpF porin